MRMEIHSPEAIIPMHDECIDRHVHAMLMAYLEIPSEPSWRLNAVGINSRD